LHYSLKFEQHANSWEILRGKPPEEEGGRKLTVGCPMEVAPYPASGLAYIDVTTPAKVSTSAKNIFTPALGCKWLLSNHCWGIYRRAH
jgi:hypothetical protein